MTVKYKTVITKAGAEKLAAATVPNGKKVNFTAMAVGDGGGTLPVPDAGQTKLVNEVWRHALNKISQDNKHQNYVIAELLIPPETGGFWMREMGLYDDTGTLIAVGNMAESYKPLLAEGSGRAQTVRMVIMVSDIESVELSIDTSTVMATQEYVDEKLEEHEQSRRHPDATLTAKGFTQLSSATDSSSEALAATPKAVKAANDNANGRVPSGRKVNGRPLTEDISITAQDIFNGQAVSIGNAIDLNTLTTPGLYYQTANVQAASGKNYPEPAAGSLEVYKHAGITQVYRIYSNSGSYIRTFYNSVWSGWRMQYDADHKPTPAEIGAVSAQGGDYNGVLRFGSVGTVPTERNSAKLISAQPSGAGGIVSGAMFEWYDNSMAIGLTRGNSTDATGFSIWLNNKNLFNIDPSGNTGVAGNLVTVGSIYSNYVQTSGDLRSERNISSKGLIQAGSGLFDTPGVRVYSPNNPPPQQDLSPYATTAWVNGNFSTQAWTVANFLQGGMRLASSGTATNGNNDNTFAYAPDGAVVTAVQQKTNYTAVLYRYVQYNIGGNWYTAWVA
ncbi:MULTISPECIES: phage tail protein [unclassified Enterobacter cloacae complex]|uniref:phage tail-collar fiber domain-containing protein n=1 Tax=unclassified Enterobacter cloacae complex TaxID=2757714 RepID=UPI001D0BF383|nr:MULTISPECIES: phage tail protein [unclassified Enterobacter cloacae complex]